VDNLNRIYSIASDLVYMWNKYPNLRLGQLISNAMNGCGADLFYIEDNELIKRIKDFVEGVKDVGNKD
jgi:hypothetical protein